MKLGLLITQISACGLLDGSSRTVWNSVIEYYSTFFPCGATKSNKLPTTSILFTFQKGHYRGMARTSLRLVRVQRYDYAYGTGTIYL